MSRRVALAVAAICVALVGGFVHVFVIGPGPGDCGLGTGGLVYANTTTDPVGGPDEARARMAATLANPEHEGLVTRLVADPDEYERATLDPEFRDDVEDRIEEDERVYYFAPGGDPRYGTGTVGVRESGTVFVVQVGAC